MRRSRLLAVVVLILGLAGCSTEEDTTLMPDVTGQRLDAAIATIEGAGFTDDVDVDGGGMFGVVDESNWQVCEQSPAAGSELTETPRLTVDRSCGNDSEEASNATETPTEPEVEASPSEPAVITAASDPTFAAILAEGDNCSEVIAQFASDHKGDAIEFDASVGALGLHDGTTTRYDILVTAGDFSEVSQRGPTFQFRDVNTTSDLNWTNESATGTVGVGDNLHIVATVGEFDANSCLFLIDPVAASFR